MGKIIRRIMLVLLLIAAGAGYYQWQAYGQKAELRKDGLLYFEEEDYTKSIQYLRQGLKKTALFSGEMDRDMTCYLAESYYQMEEYGKASALYDELLKEDDTNPMYYQLKGECYKAAKKYDKAVKVFEKGVEKTGDVNFLKEICDIYMTQEKYEDALKYAQRGAKGSGQAGKELLYQTIIIYEKSQNYQAAYEAASSYCERYPDDERAKKEMVFLSTRI